MIFWLHKWLWAGTRSFCSKQGTNSGWGCDVVLCFWKWLHFAKENTCVSVLKNYGEWIHKLMCTGTKNYVAISGYSDLLFVIVYFRILCVVIMDQFQCCQASSERPPRVFCFFVIHPVIYLMLQCAQLLSNPYTNHYSIFLDIVHEEESNQGQTIVTCTISPVYNTG